MLQFLKLFWKKLFYPYNFSTYKILLLLEPKEQRLFFLVTELSSDCSVGRVASTMYKLEFDGYVTRTGDRQTGVLFTLTPDGSTHLKKLDDLYADNK